MTIASKQLKFAMKAIRWEGSILHNAIFGEVVLKKWRVGAKSWRASVEGGQVDTPPNYHWLHFLEKRLAEVPRYMQTVYDAEMIKKSSKRILGRGWTWEEEFETEELKKRHAPTLGRRSKARMGKTHYGNG